MRDANENQRLVQAGVLVAPTCLAQRRLGQALLFGFSSEKWAVAENFRFGDEAEISSLPLRGSPSRRLRPIGNSA